MTIFWVVVDVLFKTPLQVEEKTPGGRGVAHGFMQIFGCTAEHDADMRRLIETAIRTGTPGEIEITEVNYDDVGIIAPEDLDEEIFADEEIAEGITGDVQARGIWYRSARGLYDNDADEAAK